MSSATVGPADRAVFRLPGISVLVPFALFFVTAPLAAASVWTAWLFLLPVLALIYVIWTKTTADAHRITIDTWTGRRHILWADLDGLEFNGPRWAVAVTADGGRIRLPMVRPRDLPRLAAVSGGRLYLGATAVDDAESASNAGTATIGTAANDTATIDTATNDTAMIDAAMIDAAMIDTGTIGQAEKPVGPSESAPRAE